MAKGRQITIEFLGNDKTAGKTADAVAGKFDTLGSKLKKFGKVAAASLAVAGAGTIAAGKYFFETSARLEQMGAKAETVFGKSLPVVKKWASESAHAMGLTRTEATGLAANFGDLLIPMGFTRREAAKMSTDVVGLSGALSQWSGGTKSAAEVTEILNAAMLGETDGLKALGISISAAEVDAELLRKGQDKLTGSAKQQAEALAIQRLIFAKSTDAQKKFAEGGSPLLSAQARLKARFKEIRDTIAVKLIPAFSIAADWALTKLPRAFNKLKDAFKKVRDRLSDAFDGINIKGIGSKLATQAKSWAAPVIDGFKTGLNTGDWSGLGSAIGTGIVQAVKGIGQMISKVTAALVEIFGRVDWMGIGIAMGKQAPTLLVGLAMGLLNFDIMGLLKGLADHWQEALFAVIAVAFMPAKVIGAVGKVLAKIPFVGKMLEWALLHFKKFSDGLVGMVGKALKFLGSAFMTGFRRVFPGVGARFSAELALLPLRLQIMALELVQKAGKMMAGLAGAIGKGIAGVVAKIGELTAKMLKPFVNAGSWLINVGKDLIRGLISGIWSMAGDLVAAIKGAVTDKIPGFIKDRLGIHSPSIVLTKIGHNIMDGLIGGIKSKGTALQSALEKITGYITGQVDKLKGLLSTRDDFAKGFQSFTSSVFSADFSDPETGQNNTSVEAMIAYQKAQKAKARQLAADVRKLIKLGLSPALIRQLQESGESGIEQIHALAGGSAADIKELNALTASTTSALNAAGMAAGNEIYGDKIRETRANVATAKAIRDELEKLLKQQDKNTVVVLKLGAHQIRASLLELKRQSNRNLGLT